MKAGWELKALGDVCEIAPKKALVKKTLTDEQLVSFVPMDHLGELESHFTAKEDRQLSSVYKGYTYFCDNDVIIAKITPCFENGKMGVVSGMTNGVGFGSSEFVPIRGQGKTLPKYLFYYLLRNDFRENGARVMSGAVGHKRVPKEYIENLPIPLPPLEEQKRIVSILDEAFEGLDRARENAEANLKSARELFESALELELGSLKHHKACLASIIESTLIGLVRNNRQQNVSGPTPYIKMHNIGSDGKFNTNKLARVECTADELERYRLKKGDFLFNTRNSFDLVGKTCIYGDELTTAVVFNNNIMRIRFRQGIHSSFIALLFQSQKVIDQLTAIKSGTTSVVAIYGKSLQKISLQIPSGPIQIRIVEKIGRIKSDLETIESNYNVKLQDICDLRQSLLQKAFAGELT